MTLDNLTWDTKRGVGFGQSSETVNTPTTAGSNTGVAQVAEFQEKTFGFINTSDRSVDFQVQGSNDPAFTDVWSLGSAVTLTAGDVTTQYDQAVLTDYWPYLRVNITAQSSDAGVGAATVVLMCQKH